MPKIDEMYAFCAEQGPDDEGVIAIQDNQGMWIPLTGADMSRIESLRADAQMAGWRTGCRVVLKRFKLVSEEEV